MTRAEQQALTEETSGDDKAMPHSPSLSSSSTSSSSSSSSSESDGEVAEDLQIENLEKALVESPSNYDLHVEVMLSPVIAFSRSIRRVLGFRV